MKVDKKKVLEKFTNIKDLFFIQLSIFLFLLFLAEIGSFILLSMKVGFKKSLSYHPLSKVILKIENFNKKTNRVPHLGNFSPLVQDRYQPNTNFGDLKINECGFISNHSYKESCLKELKMIKF